MKNLPISNALLGNPGEIFESTVDANGAFDTLCPNGIACHVGDQWCRVMCSHYRDGFFMDFEDGMRTFILCSFSN